MGHRQRLLAVLPPIRLSYRPLSPICLSPERRDLTSDNRKMIRIYMVSQTTDKWNHLTISIAVGNAVAQRVLVPNVSPPL